MTYNSHSLESRILSLPRRTLNTVEFLGQRLSNSGDLMGFVACHSNDPSNALRNARFFRDDEVLYVSCFSDVAAAMLSI